MNLAATLFCAVTTLLSVQAITVSVDRADVRPVNIQPEQGQSMFVNGWRPVTARYENIGVNVSPASNLERSLAPLHPVLGKLQEHMSKSQLRPKTQQVEYAPASILGSFAVFSHPGLQKQRLEGTDPKTLSTEREYSFLIPPPRDALRFELEPLKKAPLAEPYVRSSQFIPQSIKPDPRAPTYYIKPASFSTSVNPYARPYYTQQQQQQQQQPQPQPQPQQQQQQQQQQPGKFEATKTKPYYQTADAAAKQQSEQNAYDRYQQQVVNSNYYNQINHPAHYKQSTYERDPAFLVHESHEVSYATPSSSFKFRPFHFETQPPFSSPRPAEPGKFSQQPQQQTTSRPAEPYKQFNKELDKEPHRGAFYIQEFHKARYTPDINEVLPKVNQPVKFSQTTPAFLQPDRAKLVYVRPELQQPQQHYPSSVIPLNINQRPTEVEYETPESISLKHFNEQQFLLQQQLIHQDRLRLREQEKRRQHELQRQQQEELAKRQQEIKLLEQRQKEKQRLEQLHTAQPDIQKEVTHRPTTQHYSQQFSQQIDEPKKIPQAKEQYKYAHHYEVPTTSEAPFHPSKEDHAFKPVTVQKSEELVTPTASVQPTTQEDFQPMIRPYRPQKPHHREQARRRKPTTVAYEPVPTEAPVFYSPETQPTLTDIPIQTTIAPETTTIPVTERAVRTRRPGGPGAARRRRPSTTTSTQEPSSSSQEYEDEITKYNTPENQEFEKKKRVRPVAANQHESSIERRPISRKRPGQRGKGYKEQVDFDTIAKTTQQPFREISATENYPEAFLKELFSGEYTPTSDRSVETSREVSTQNVPLEFYAETTVPSSLEYYEPTRDDRQEQYNTQKAEDAGALDHIFTRTEVNFVEGTTAQATTAPAPTTTSTSTTTTTTTTTEAPSTYKPSLSSKATLRMRPSRYGNATRPRFSIKDYKSRMEYKNRLAASSSTEAPSTSVTQGPKRGHKAQPEPGTKEPSGRYKYTSRATYRGSGLTPTPQPAAGSPPTTDDPSGERPTRFAPKKRVNSGQYYRNRSAAAAAEHTTGRPEPRKRPTLKSRLALRPLEMQSLAETGSFATTTLEPAAPSSPAAAATATPTSSSEAANEITEPPPALGHADKPDLSDVSMDESDNYPSATTSPRPTTTTTTAFDLSHEEELFAKASQSVADLTSSASALYDKPGMFKNVSPAGENRVISAHLKIATDEPTLPIEAFFHEIARKN